MINEKEELLKLRAYVARLEDVLLYGFEFDRCTCCGEIYHCEDGANDLEDRFVCTTCADAHDQLGTDEGRD